jgi:hypothetical protein
MLRHVGIFSVLLGGLALLGLSLLVHARSVGIAAPSTGEPAFAGKGLKPGPASTVPAQTLSTEAVLPSPALPSPRGALKSGILIVVSLPSQKLFVFRDGKLWDSSPISTGRRGYETPAGVFTIMQKKVRHRSTLYDDAPMPYMQRLTWAGIAFHAGRVPGYPASHGCIRLPASFARKLYGVTDPATTAVLVSDLPTGSAAEALGLAAGEPVAPAPAERMAEALTTPADREAQPQTIQLAAAANPRNADRLWQHLFRRRPELRQLDHAIIGATVRSGAVFRLRASGPDAHPICKRLRAAGIACLKVSG